MHSPDSQDQGSYPNQHEQGDRQNEWVEHYILVQSVAEYGRERCQTKTPPTGETISFGGVIDNLAMDYCGHDRQKRDGETECHGEHVKSVHRVGEAQRVEWESDFPE